eukprot:12426564-Karenia_brevis.AAC.1
MYGGQHDISQLLDADSLSRIRRLQQQLPTADVAAHSSSLPAQCSVCGDTGWVGNKRCPNCLA